MHLQAIVQAQRRGTPRAIPAVCSAHPQVIAAALAEGVRSGAQVLVEATCNQVNQEGGYTGMTPSDFVSTVRTQAGEAGLPADRLLLGGDHIGPNPWRSERAHRAMANAHRLVREFVAAGIDKLHIDATMRLIDDPNPLPLETIAERTADLVATAEQIHKGMPVGLAAPVYVIGSDVPAPGGAAEHAPAPRVTSTDELTQLLALTKAAFRRRRLDAALPRIVAIVADPGITFSAEAVTPYQPERASHLRTFTQGTGLMLEAHATDYQPAHALHQMVSDGFGVLKLGPELTYAYREAIFALAEIEGEVFGTRRGAVKNVRDVLAGVMRANPTHWRDYYAYKAPESDWLFGFSDRVRYYWPHPAVRSAVATLLANLDAEGIPLTLLSQYMPRQYEAVRRGTLDPQPLALVRHAIVLSLRRYHTACQEDPTWTS